MDRSNRYALLTVFDKTGIVDFARSIDALGIKIIATSGTAKTLTDAGLNVIPIQAITGNPESFDARVKSISFQIASGILYDRKNPMHVQEAKKLGVKKIDLVVANLYPFEKAVANPKVSLNAAIENIDVGGATMIRAAAKNFKNVLVVVDPLDYPLLTPLLHSVQVQNNIRRKLAAKAFSYLSFYDSQVARFFDKDLFPKELTIPGRKSINLRYGENPHQKGSIYFEPNNNSPLCNLKKITGRDLSYVNFTDIAAGIEAVRLFQKPAAVVIKHNSPSGIALGDSSYQALIRAVEADPESAFGGVIVLNKSLDIKTARAFADFKENNVLIDIVASLSITSHAKEFIKKVRKTTGIYTFGKIPDRRSNPMHLRFFDGGFIMQDWDDNIEEGFKNWKVAGKIKPNPQQLEQMKIAWKFIARIRSNAVAVIDKDIPMTRGIGSGQTSRVRSARIAIEQAGSYAKGAILASDSFFPFADCVRLAAKYGIGAIVQQGGSINDKASIDAADKAGIPMVFTFERKFWH